MTRKAKALSIVMSTIAAVFAAIVSAPAAWRAAGLPVLASEAQVEAKIAPVMRAVGEVTRDTAELRREMLDREMFEWSVKLPDIHDPTVRALIERRLSTVDGQRRAVGERLRDLERARWGGN